MFGFGENTPIKKGSPTDEKQKALRFLQRVCKTCRISPEYNGTEAIHHRDYDDYCLLGRGYTYLDKKYSIRPAIRTILKNETDKVKWREFDHFMQLVQKLAAEKKQQYEEECQRQREERQRQREEDLLAERERPF